VRRNLQAAEGFSIITDSHSKVEDQSVYPSVLSGLRGGGQCRAGARSGERRTVDILRQLDTPCSQDKIPDDQVILLRSNYTQSRSIKLNHH